MNDWRTFNRETSEDRQQRRERVQALTSGQRRPDGLTDAEYALLMAIKRMGLEIERTWMISRNGQRWQAERGVRKAG